MAYLSYKNNPTREEVVDLSDFTHNTTGSNVQVNVLLNQALIDIYDSTTAYTINITKNDSSSIQQLSVSNNHYYYLYDIGSAIYDTVYFFDINERIIVGVSDKADTDSERGQIYLMKSLFTLLF